jgi:hypothetical protein
LTNEEIAKVAVGAIYNSRHVKCVDENDAVIEEEELQTILCPVIVEALKKV